MRQFEIMYVLADERDVVLLRTEHRKSDVYVYRTTATPDQDQPRFWIRSNQLCKCVEQQVKSALRLNFRHDSDQLRLLPDMRRQIQRGS